MFQTGDRTKKVSVIANSKPVIPGQFSPVIKQNISLQARHLVEIPEAATLMAVTVRAAQVAVARFLTTPPGESASIRSEEVPVSSPGQRTTLKLLPEFVLTDHPTPFAGGGGGDEWVLGIYPDLVMNFENAASPAEYVQRQLEIIEGWGDEYDGRSAALQGVGPISDQGPYRAFVVMPFGRRWSSRVHSFVRRAVDSFDGAVVAVRADEIADPGKITTQVIHELETCDFIIADITGSNANVAWELGYAYDHNKPCVILRRRRERNPAPFDIYDQRRTTYSNKPSTDDELRLIEMISRAIAQVRNASQGALGDLFK
jgi:hypothetical protein